MKLLPLSAIATLGIAALSLLTSCQDEDFGYTSEDVRAGVYDRNFIKHYGEIPENQSWDFSSFGLISRLEASRNQSLTRGTNDFPTGDWCTNGETSNVSLTYDRERSFTETHDLIQWIKKRLQENGKRVDGIATNKQEFNQRFSMIPAESGFKFSVMPVFQGIDNTIWDFHALIEWEDTEGTHSIDKVLWKKSEGMYMMGERPDIYGETIQDYVDHYVKVSDLSVLKSAELSTYKENKNTVTPNNNILYETTRLASDIQTNKAIVTGNVGSKANITFYLHVLKEGDTQVNKKFYSDGRENPNQSSSNIVVLPIQVDIPGYESNDVVLMGCETQSDDDMNDIVFLLIGEPTLPELVNHNIISKRYFFEDLGSVVDWDFNDVVLDMNQVIEFEGDKKYITQKATLKHRCGTTPFDLYLKNTDGTYTEIPFSTIKGENEHIPGVNTGTAMNVTESVNLVYRREYDANTVYPWRHADNNVAIKVYPSKSSNNKSGVSDGATNDGVWSEYKDRNQGSVIPRVFIADVNVWWTAEGENFPNMWAHPEETIITKPAGAADNEHHAGSLIGIGSNRGTRYPYLDGDRYMLWNNPTQFIQWEPLWLSEGFIEGLQHGYTTVNIEFGDCNTKFAMLYREDYTLGDTKYKVNGNEWIDNTSNDTYRFTIPSTGDGSVDYFNRAVNSNWSPSFGVQGLCESDGAKIIINKVYLTRSGSGSGGDDSNDHLSLSWNTEVNFALSNNNWSKDCRMASTEFANVEAGDEIIVYLDNIQSDKDAKLCPMTGNWDAFNTYNAKYNWNDKTFNLYVDSDIATSLKANGMAIQGKGYTIKSVKLKKVKNADWNTTYNFALTDDNWFNYALMDKNKFSDIKTGDVITVNISNVNSDAQGAFQSNWQNIDDPEDLNGKTSFSLTVTEDIKSKLQTNGLAIQGKGYTIVNITKTTPEVAVTSISLNFTEKSIAPGQTFQLTASVSPDNATDQTVTWSSSNTSAATVSNNGLVTGLAQGTTTITVTTTDGSKTATCTITVQEVPAVYEVWSGTPQTGNFEIFKGKNEWFKDGYTKLRFTFDKSYNNTWFKIYDSNWNPLGSQLSINGTTIEIDLNNNTYSSIKSSGFACNGGYTSITKVELVN